MPAVPSDPSRFEQFFRRSSSGDWVYVGYGPDISGRVVSSADREWLLEALPRLSYYKRWTVSLFSAPLVWLFALFLNTVVMFPGSEQTRWLIRNREEVGKVALFLLLGFLATTALLTMHPLAKEFGRVLAKKPKEDPIGMEKFFQNVGAVNGPFVTTFLMLGFGALVVPGAFSRDMWPYFAPLAAAWLWSAWHAWVGALWKPRDYELYE
jgi:hypothetical protein